MKALALLFAALTFSQHHSRVFGLTESDLNHECLRTCEWPPQPKTCVYNFNVDWYYSMSKACIDCPINKTHCDLQHCIPLNGVPRTIAVVNENFPGPSIQVCEGDNIVVHVTNNMGNNEGISIHWHGLHQKDTPYMDGVPMVTQCPISRHTTFTYNFKASPHGTFWWHAHSGLQRADGVFGDLIVRQAPQVDLNRAHYDYDLPEHVIAVHDWFDTLPYTEVFLPFYFKEQSGLAADCVLINGKGKRKGFENHMGETIYTEREMFTVEVGKRYRFRVYSNAIGNCPIKISIDSHKLTIVATDGVPLQPYETDAFVLQGGERYDFVLKADQEVGNYWMRVQGEATGEELALLRYKGSQDDYPPEDEPEQDSDYNLLNAWNEAFESAVSIVELEPAESEDEITSRKPDVVYYTSIDIKKVRKYFYDRSKSATDLDYYSSQINHFVFKPNSRPPLTQLDEIPKEEFCGGDPPYYQRTGCVNEICECTHTISVGLGELVEFVLVNEAEVFQLSHPMHLHGHYFTVLAQGKLGETTTVQEVMRLDQAGNITRKLEGTVTKDTVVVPSGGYTIIRFIADNPGWWLFHCHLQFDTQLGMTLLIRVGSEKDLPPKPANFPQCGSWSSASLDLRNPAPPSFHFFHVVTVTLMVLFAWKVIVS